MVHKFVPRQAQMNFFLNNPNGPVGLHFKKRALAIQTMAKLSAGVKTGALKKSIHIKHRRSPLGQDWLIGSNVSHAYMHHEGTSRHVILPKKVGGKLAFMGNRGGKPTLIVVDRVNHPGTKPNPYLSRWLYLATI